MLWVRIFKPMGISLFLGRGIEWRDAASSPRVAVVSEAMVREFSGRNPIGERFSLLPDGERFEIVGVVQNVKCTDLRAKPGPTVYFPYTRIVGFEGMHFELRTTATLLGSSIGTSACP